MKNFSLLNFFCLALFIVVVCTTSPGWSSIQNCYERITSHYDIDLSPRISPDGRWLAYVNRQTDNYDIWVRNLVDGRPHQVTYHKADDFYPVWGPDNRTLVFVSQRSDAAGDIYKLKLKKRGKELKPSGEPERVTRYLGYDSYPTISPDGKKIAWVSDRSGMDEIWFYNDNTGNTLQLTFGGGTHPCWSPVLNFISFTSFRAGENSNGDIYMMHLKGPEPADSMNRALWDSREYPTYRVTCGPALDGFSSWSADAGKIVFLRHEHDTNGDGDVTPADHGALWCADVYESPRETTSEPTWVNGFCSNLVDRAIPLTLYGYRVMQPWYADKVYASFDIDDNVDIYAIADSGCLPRKADAVEQLGFAETSYPLSGNIDQKVPGPLFVGWNPARLSRDDRILLWQRCIALHRVLDFFGTQSPASATALYHIAVCHLLLGFEESAVTYLHYLLDQYSQPQEILFYAELALLGRQESDLQARLMQIASRYPLQSRVLAGAQFEIGKATGQRAALKTAISEYQRIISKNSGQPALQARATYQIAKIYKAQQDTTRALETYIEIISFYPDQKEWQQNAQQQFFELKTQSKSGNAVRKVYQDIIRDYAHLPLLVSSAKLSLADSLLQWGETDSAYCLYDDIDDNSTRMTEKIKHARIGLARCLQKQGAYEAAFELLQNTVERFESAYPDYAVEVKSEWVQGLMRLGNELRFFRRYEEAKQYYARAKKISPRHMDAHRCYIETKYELDEIDEAITEYEILTNAHPENYILVYSHGLCLSYKGTEVADRSNDPGKIDLEMLHSSSNRVAQALVKDFTMIQPYVTLSFNYEMTEDYLNYKASAPKSVFVRVYETLLTPLRFIYRTVTFQDPPKPPRFYERAIHELTKAIHMNDEKENPAFEAMIAMNLANTHYKMGEFGYDKAYQYYRVKLKYDSSFVDMKHKASTFERLGHCALILEKYDRGVYYILRTIRLYEEMGQKDHVLLNTKRMALLYETAEQHMQAIDYYQECAGIEERNGRYSDLTKSYRSIAYNYYLMNRSEAAIDYAQRSLDLIESGQAERIKAETRRFKVGLLDLYVPVPFFGIKPIGTASLKGLTTDDERALLYTIISESYIHLRRYEQAIDFYQQKMEIYEQYKDKSPKAAFLNHLARLYFLKGDYETAFQYYLQSLGICEEYDLIYAYCINSLNLAELMADRLVWEKFNTAEQKQTFSRFRALTLEHLQTALELSENEFYVLNEYSRLLLAKGQFYLLPLFYKNSNAEMTLSDLTGAAEANQYLNQTLEISLRYGYTRQESVAHLLLGMLAQKLGDLSGAASHLQRVRWLSFNQSYFDLVWQSDILLGDITKHLDRAARQKLTLKVPLYYYNEAINIIEKLRPNKIGIHTLEYRKIYQEPYWRMISFQNERKHHHRALLYAEQLRLGMFSVLSENGYIHFEDLRSAATNDMYRELIKDNNRLQLEMIRIVNRSQVSQKDLVEIRREISMLKEKIEEIQILVKEQDPQLYRLYDNDPVGLDDIQALLNDDHVIFYFQRVADSLACYTIYSSNISLHVVALSDQMIRLMDNPALYSEPGVADRLDLQIFDSFFDLKTSLEKVIVVPDISTLTWPWLPLLRKQGVDCPVSFGSSLKSIYLSHLNKKDKNKTVYFAGSETIKASIPEDTDVIQPVSNTRSNSFYNQLSQLGRAGIIHLQVQSLWNELDPWFSRLGFAVRRSHAAVFRPADLFNQALVAGLVFLQVEQPATLFSHPWSVMMWEQAFIRCGSRAVLFTTQNPGQDQRVYREVYKRLDDLPANEDYKDILQAFPETDRDSEFYFYGF